MGIFDPIIVQEEERKKNLFESLIPVARDRPEWQQHALPAVGPEESPGSLFGNLFFRYAAGLAAAPGGMAVLSEDIHQQAEAEGAHPYSKVAAAFLPRPSPQFLEKGHSSLRDLSYTQDRLAGRLAEGGVPPVLSAAIDTGLDFADVPLTLGAGALKTGVNTSRAIGRSAALGIDEAFMSLGREMGSTIPQAAGRSSILAALEAPGAAGSRLFSAAGRYKGFGDEAREVMELSHAGEAQTRTHAVKAAANSKRVKQSVDKLVSEGANEAEVKKYIFQRMNGDDVPSPFTENLEEIIEPVRAHIDEISTEYIKSGRLGADLQETFEGGIGNYIRRAYMMNLDAGFRKELLKGTAGKEADRWQTGFNFLKGEELERLRKGADGALTEEELQALVPKDLDQKVAGRLEATIRAAEKGDIFFSGASPHVKKILRRKEVPEEMRYFLGEVDEPVDAYAIAVAHMAGDVSSYRFLKSVREVGGGKHFLDEPIPGMASEIDPTRRKTKGEIFHGQRPENLDNPLSGLFTSEDIVRDLTRATALAPKATGTWGGLINGYMRANGWVKSALTVQNVPQSHMRNFQAWFPFSLSNGHDPTNVARWAESAKHIKSGFDRTPTPFFMEGVERGVFKESVVANEVAHYVSQAGGGSRGGGLVSRFFNGLQEAYAAGDDTGKGYIWMAEIEKYGKALPGLSRDELLDITAKNTRITTPTYSMAPRIADYARDSPITGAFSTFYIETVRSKAATVGLALREIKSGNPGLRNIGMKRLAGMAAVLAIPEAAQEYSRQMSGISHDAHRGMVELVAEYDKDGEFIFFGQDQDGNVRYVNLSYTDPLSVLKEPFKRLLRTGEYDEKSWLEAGFAALKSAAEPVFGKEPLFGAVTNIAFNMRDGGAGGRLYDPKDKEYAAKDIYKEASRVAVPRPFRVTSEAIFDKKRSSRFSPGIEAVSSVSGFRLKKFDPIVALHYSVGNFMREKSDASGAYGRRVIFDSVPQEVAEREAQKIFVESYTAFQRKVQGVLQYRSYAETQKALRDSGVPKWLVGPLLNGEEAPDIISESTRERAEDKERRLTGMRIIQ